MLESDGLIQEAQEKGALLAELLQQIPGVKAVRGLGLMRAAQLEFEGSQQVAERLLELGVIVNSVTKDALRITPPLCISRQEIEYGVSQIARAIADELDARQAA